MKVVKADLPSEYKKLEIHPLADLHIGDAMCDYKLILEELEYIKNTPNAVCLLDGDLMDTAIAQSVGDTYGANLQPKQQLEHCVKLFKPLADAGKILAVVGGNHENRVYKETGIDMTALMCAQLGIADRYSETTAVVIIRFGDAGTTHHHRKMCYTLYMTHGSGGGGRKEGGKINRLADLAEIVDADIYVHAHTHLPAAFRNRFFRIDTSNNCLTQVEHLFVNTAARLNYGGYGDKAAFKPSSTINPVIILYGDGKKKMKALV